LPLCGETGRKGTGSYKKRYKKGTGRPMSDNITVRGFVATDVKISTTHGGTAVSSFRMGSTERRYDRKTETWYDGPTNWFSVSMYRQLATNAGCSLKKGQLIIVVGKLRLRQWEKDGRTFTSADINAESVGHDLMWGSANYIRNSQASAATAPADATSPADATEQGTELAEDAPVSDESELLQIVDVGDDEVTVDTSTGEVLEDELVGSPI
jgi:single-strand DNA-binding protein